jgi:hypothetical protein
MQRTPLVMAELNVLVSSLGLSKAEEKRIREVVEDHGHAIADTYGECTAVAAATHIVQAERGRGLGPAEIAEEGAYSPLDVANAADKLAAEVA